MTLIVSTPTLPPMSSSVIFSTAHHTCPTLFILVLTLLASGIVELVLSIDDPLSPAQCVEGQLGPSELVVPRIAHSQVDPGESSTASTSGGSGTPRLNVDRSPVATSPAGSHSTHTSLEAQQRAATRLSYPVCPGCQHTGSVYLETFRALTKCAHPNMKCTHGHDFPWPCNKYGTITRSYCVRRFIRSEEGCYWTEDPRHWRYDCDHIRVHRRGELAPGGEVIATEDPIYGQAQEQAHQETGVRGVPAHIRTGARIHVQVEEPEVRDDPGPKSDEDDCE
ncbi:hypothetical protein KEM48_004317 [Puccinia striiformis f. sp. tritici PST-130]|nr:hypothetical protein KEM48_004317 [Puccinia striiformis f. sp. tritici PST-130]